MRAFILPFLCATMLSGCAGRPNAFSDQNARAHVNQLAGAIGSRPAGSDANRRAREYLIDQLRFFGYTVRVQEAQAERADLGISAHVFNIIAIIPGARPDALGLVAHYDSRATTPGAGDDALGVAVALECARLLAARPARQHAVMVLLTDAEEEGLMGAAALVRDPEVAARLRAYINLDAIGADGPVPLFQTGPGNGWLVGAWAQAAGGRRGGSYQVEIYKRLPSDTDFSVLARAGIPGLNFAAVGDGYAYHTPRDTADRLTTRAIADMGTAALSTAESLDRADLAQRSSAQAVYFDVAGARALVLRPSFSRALSVLAIVLATIAVVRTTRVTAGAGGTGGVIRTFGWAVAGVLLVGAALLGMTALLREAREVYHPWYAHPWRFWALLVLTLFVTVEILLRAGDRLPRAWRAVRHPAAVWMVTLVCWLAMAAVAEGFAPAAAYLWSVPLLVLSLTAVVAPAADRFAAAVGALIVLAVSGALWLPEGREMLRFGVPMFGRLPILTPLAVYPAAVLLIAAMVAPAVLAVDMATGPPLPEAHLTPGRRRLRILLTPALLVALSIAFAACYLAEAYTFDRPLQRAVQYVADHGTGRAVWEVAGVEPGLDVDLSRGAPAGWVAATGPLLAGVRATALPHPFAFRAPGVIQPAPDPGHAPERHRTRRRDTCRCRCHSISERPDAVVPRSDGARPRALDPAWGGPGRRMDGIARRGARWHNRALRNVPGRLRRHGWARCAWAPWIGDCPAARAGCDSHPGSRPPARCGTPAACTWWFPRPKHSSHRYVRLRNGYAPSRNGTLRSSEGWCRKSWRTPSSTARSSPRRPSSIASAS